MGTPILHTDKITLRAPELEDVEMMFEFENDEEIWGFGKSTGPYSRYQLRQFIETSTNDLYIDGQLRLIIENREGKPVGMVDLISFDARNFRAELGIVIQKAYRRRGYALAALRLLERHCFGVLGLHNLYAYIQKKNVCSAKLFAALGYHLAGELDDWLYVGGRYEPVEIWQKVNRLSS